MTAAAAAVLNRDCFCVPIDTAAAERKLRIARLPPSELGEAAGMVSSQAVFVAREHVAAMHELIAAVERVVRLPGYQAAALADAPPLARRLPPRYPVLNGFDFHLAEDGPRLIEINTNAGGAALAIAAAEALRASCPPPADLRPAPAGDPWAGLWHMFRDAWAAARPGVPLARVAIVDDAPRTQYLYREFLAIQALFRRHGVAAVVADPASLRVRHGRLWHDHGPVDLVYNRLTDFYLQAPEHRVLADAALTGVAVVTPDPRAHALYANKRNLARLSDPRALERWGVPAPLIETLQRHVPPTEVVSPEQGARWWAQRKHWFFKPAHGFGSRGSYRGDKITRTRFEEVLRGGYVAQAMVPPPARRAAADAEPLRFDVRSFVYRGRSLLLTARLYRGQTTNFRTPGGGFAPVLHPPAGLWACQEPVTGE